jgi:glyoxylase-like metal-dependent hydrolase (beta-lactamase superfamily II)
MEKSIRNILTILLLTSFSAHAQQPGYYRLQVGDIQVTALSDGTVPLDMDKLLSNTQPGEVKKLLSLNFMPTTVETSVNAYLVKTGDKLILVDAGAAGNFGPTAGQLIKSLANAGYSPNQIDAVLITHVHVDHVSGLVDGEKLVFPNATIYISKPEADFWFGAKSKANMPEQLKGSYKIAGASVGPYMKAGKVKTFDYGGELFPGILPLARPGHTPGHTFYMLSSKGEKLLFWGDIIHSAAIQFTDPSVTIGFDIDSKAAAATRKQAFAKAAKEGYWIASDHISFPGIGHVRTEGSKYIWVPANYSTYTLAE